MNKEQLTLSIAAWLKDFLNSKFGNSYKTIQVLTPKRKLNLLVNDLLSDTTNSNAWEFKSDVIAILTKENGLRDIVLVNRSTTSISLKEIGEMNCYAQLAAPMLALVISPKAASSEVNSILLDNHMRKRILDYGGKYPLSVIGWDQENNKPQSNTISPIDMESLFLN